VESFVKETKTILAKATDEKKYRSIAEKYDWRLISKDYEKVLEKASHGDRVQHDLSE